MSVESANAIVERLKTDEEFTNNINEAPDDESRKKFIKSEGYHFTKEDLDSVISELSDEELDNIAGGVFTKNKIPTFD